LGLWFCRWQVRWSPSKKEGQEDLRQLVRKLDVVAIEGARLPVSGNNSTRIDRLLACPQTSIYQYDPKKACNHFSGKALSISALQNKCREAKLTVSGTKYEVVLRLIQHECGGSPNVNVFRRQKLNKAIATRLAWKSSMRGMQGVVVKGARVDIDCPEPEVFTAMFDDVQKKGSKMTKVFESEEDIDDAGLHGKSYQYGAVAYLKAPASLSLNNGKLSFAFKYTVSC
jgi:hypothetical protein